MTLSELVIKHEGLRLDLYKDSVGVNTIGVGRNLDANGISEDEAMLMLSNDLRRTERELEAFSFARYLNEPRRIALCSMLFNLGLSRFTRFKLMIAALEAKSWDAAAQEMLNSKWADQVGTRATELATIMRTGHVD